MIMMCVHTAMVRVHVLTAVCAKALMTLSPSTAGRMSRLKSTAAGNWRVSMSRSTCTW